MLRGIRFFLALALLAVPLAPARAQTINEKILAYCKKQLGKKVGAGECTNLADEAMKAAGAMSSNAFPDSPGRDDYVWGRLVYVLTAKDGRLQETKTKGETIQPGDLIQIRGVRIEGKTAAGGTYFRAFAQHTAVVAAWKEKGRVLTLFEQNVNGKRQAVQNTYRFDDLKTGWMRVYRAVPDRPKKKKLSAEEKSERLWTSLENRCKEMLAAQKKVQAGAKQLQKIIAANPGQKPRAEDKRAAIKLADEQKAIVATAANIVAELNADGAAVAFPEVFDQLRKDMQAVENRLRACDVGPATQTLVTDCVDTLAEMVSALRKGR